MRRRLVEYLGCGRVEKQSRDPAVNFVVTKTTDITAKIIPSAAAPAASVFFIYILFYKNGITPGGGYSFLINILLKDPNTWTFRIYVKLVWGPLLSNKYIYLYVWYYYICLYNIYQTLRLCYAEGYPPNLRRSDLN